MSYLESFVIIFGVIFSPLVIALGADTDNSVVFQVIQSQMVFNSSTVESATINSPKSTSDSYGINLKLKTIAVNKFVSPQKSHLCNTYQF